MNKDIKVSVIIPIHNVEDYLAECLDSVRLCSDTWCIMCYASSGVDLYGRDLPGYPADCSH